MRSIIKLNISKKQIQSTSSVSKRCFPLRLNVMQQMFNDAIAWVMFRMCVLLHVYSCSLAHCHIVSQYGKLSHYTNALLLLISLIFFRSLSLFIRFLILIACLQLSNICKTLTTNGIHNSQELLRCVCFLYCYFTHSCIIKPISFNYIPKSAQY